MKQCILPGPPHLSAASNQFLLQSCQRDEECDTRASAIDKAYPSIATQLRTINLQLVTVDQKRTSRIERLERLVVELSLIKLVLVQCDRTVTFCRIRSAAP